MVELYKDMSFKQANKKKLVFAAMSGGVDSSVAALLLKRRGYQTVGVFIHSYNLDGCEEKDAEDARITAAKIGIPFYVWNLEKEYREKVVEYMIDGYRRGFTPNPDVVCNEKIKFGLFLEKALRAGADYVATGHYIKIQKSKVKDQNDNSKFKIVYKLFQAKDKNKDQSYFLWTLGQTQLKHCLFPIGEYLKPEVRKIAEKAGLPTAEKKDSQGICFLGKIRLFDFLRQYIPEKRGRVLTVEGEEIGEHRGVWFYTIGQRHIGILNFRGRKSDSGKPYYVVRKDVKRNILIVAQGQDHPALYHKKINLTGVNFINPLEASKILKQKVFVRVRYRQPLTPATLISKRNAYELLFDQPQKFVAEGQSAVFYGKDGELLGGGIIVDS